MVTTRRMALRKQGIDGGEIDDGVSASTKDARSSMDPQGHQKASDGSKNAVGPLVVQVVGLLWWSASSSALIFVNKMAMVDYGFRYPMMLTAIGLFAAAAGGAQLGSSANVFVLECVGCQRARGVLWRAGWLMRLVNLVFWQAGFCRSWALPECSWGGRRPAVFSS
jgi:hypothetical protein